MWPLHFNCRHPVLFGEIMVRERMGSGPTDCARAQEDGGDEPAGERGLLARQPLLRRAAGQGAPPTPRPWPTRWRLVVIAHMRAAHCPWLSFAVGLLLVALL